MTPATSASGAICTRKGEETRNRILDAATDLIHRQGFKNTGLQEILEASGVPRGSFYFYFKSKEELGRELVVRYRQNSHRELESRPFPGPGPVVPQLMAFFEEGARAQAEGGCKAGCLLGNLAIELSDAQEDLRREVAGCFDDLRAMFARALAQGQTTGELASDFKPEAAAEFLVAVMEGAILVAKAQREPTSFEASLAMLNRFLHSLLSRPAPDTRASSPAPTGGQP
jgi:TetR/AcrR family transcriptional repressor of nem operon